MQILKPYSLDGWERLNLGLYDMVSLSDEKALLTSPKTKRIIACSNLVKKQIVQYYGVNPAHIEVIPNGITPRECERRSTNPMEMRKEWGISREDKVLLFMGNEFARKGLPTVLEAMARLAMPDLRLLVAGSGNIPPYKDLAEALRLTGRVTFLGSVEDPERWFDISDLFIFPTLYEPFGMVVMEAMAAGVPVITSRSCGATEGMTHGLHGIFLDDPTSAGEVAEWIRTLLGDKSLRMKLSAAGRNIAGQFCWDTVADRTLEVLRSASMER
jgi:UDP-glucose:(heptosyl)LPS alpha-1,3-glucosyltransferase